MKLKKIEIKNLWGNDITWELNDDVNILIGKNGSGKSTLLQIIKEAVEPLDSDNVDFRKFDLIDEAIIELSDNVIIRANSSDRTITGLHDEHEYRLNTAYVNTFDVIEKSLDPNLTLLDAEIEKLQVRFIRYQRDIANEVEEMLKSDDIVSRSNKLEQIDRLYNNKRVFLDILDDWMGDSDKRFDEKNFTFVSKNTDKSIPMNKLSSGEKQAFLIFLTVLLEDDNDFILMMDEPEISMHLEWQRDLIGCIKRLNPNCQIVATTHSPTIYYGEWIESVSRMEDVSQHASLDSDILSSQTTEEPNKISEIETAFSNLIGGPKSKLYNFNKILSSYTAFTLSESIQILNILKSHRIYADIFTFTTLISRVNRYDDALEIFALILGQEYSNLNHVQPNEVTLSALVKKAPDVETALSLFQDITSNDRIQLYPDIISFSIVLGKARNLDEVKLLEEARKYYGIEMNEAYKNRLSLKRY